MSDKSILIIDDDAEMAEFVADVVEMEQLKPLVATSAKEALGKLSASCIIGIFMDIVMPDMDGVELVQEIGKTGKAVPVVLMSGYDDLYMNNAETIGEANGAIVIGKLAKPFSVDDVAGHVRAMRDAFV